MAEAPTHQAKAVQFDDDCTNLGRHKRPRISKRAMRAYNKLMCDAATEERAKHFYHIRHWGAAKRLPMGSVSTQIYERIIKARSYDEYCRPVPPHEETKEETVRGPMHTAESIG
jgi:hypothetical protein